jgi:hypothetical protein
VEQRKSDGSNTGIAQLQTQLGEKEIAVSKFLVSREDIRAWASSRGGNPMLFATPALRDESVLLQISFGQHAFDADRNEGPDTALTSTWELTSWDDWFEEFEKQNLAIAVLDEEPGVMSRTFEFVSRDSGKRVTSRSAQKPAALTVQMPGDSD